LPLLPFGRGHGVYFRASARTFDREAEVGVSLSVVHVHAAADPEAGIDRLADRGDDALIGPHAIERLAVDVAALDGAEDDEHQRRGERGAEEDQNPAADQEDLQAAAALLRRRLP